MENPLKVFKVLFLDDEKSITKLAETVFSDDFDVITANTPEEAIKTIEDHDIGIIISDYNMPRMNGIDFLTEILEKNPIIKRILISGRMDMDIAFDSINKAKIDLIVEKPWDFLDFKNKLSDLMMKFIKENENSKRFKELESDKHQKISDVYRHTDDLLDILSNLKESRKISEFATHFLSVLEGIQSLTLVNIEFYLDSKDQVILEHAFRYLSDIEVIANQYDQKALSLYVFLLRAYAYGISESFSDSRLNYLGAKTLYQWIKDSYIANTMIEALEQFPIKDENVNLENNPMIIRVLEMHIRRLLSINIGDLINVTESIFDLISNVSSSISYFVVIRKEIPIYNKKGVNQKTEASLISGFVVALSQFLKETVKGSGDINTITHNKGVILVHHQNEINYVLFLSVNDIRYRIALREFATQSSEIFNSLPTNHIVSKAEQIKLDKLVKEILGEF